MSHLLELILLLMSGLDDRAKFACEQRYPGVNEIRVVEHFTDCFSGVALDDFVVIVTRGHQYDMDVLASALRAEAGYIGMIGSSKNRKHT